MGNGAVDPNLAVSVVQIVGALAATLITIVGILWRGLVWLDRRMSEQIGGWSSSPSFRASVAEVVTAAFAPAIDLQNRLHEEHRREIKSIRDNDIADLRKNDDERKEAVKRLHGRCDDLWKVVAK